MQVAVKVMIHFSVMWYIPKWFRFVFYKLLTTKLQITKIKYEIVYGFENMTRRALWTKNLMLSPSWLMAYIYIYIYIPSTIHWPPVISYQKAYLFMNNLNKYFKEYFVRANRTCGNISLITVFISRGQRGLRFLNAKKWSLIRYKRLGRLVLFIWDGWMAE